MSIRFTITDRATGETIKLDAPVRKEFTKDGVTKVLPPSREACENLKAVIKGRSKLGLGCLA